VGSKISEGAHNLRYMVKQNAFFNGILNNFDNNTLNIKVREGDNHLLELESENFVYSPDANNETSGSYNDNTNETDS
jgi:hypothetical protein